MSGRDRGRREGRGLGRAGQDGDGERMMSDSLFPLALFAIFWGVLVLV